VKWAMVKKFLSPSTARLWLIEILANGMEPKPTFTEYKAVPVSGSLPPLQKSLHQRITAIPAGADVVSVTGKPFDGVYVMGSDSCAGRSWACFPVVSVSFYP
jgi:hypothetical protein